MKVEIWILLVTVLASSAAGQDEKQLAEGRGKAKFALLIHFFYVVATKLFVLKIVYGAIFYVLIVKGWHFVSWFIHYLKKKQDHHEYVEYHEPYHNHHEYGHEYGHDHDYGHDHYGPPSYDPYWSYAHENQGYGDFKKTYDADGSFSIKS